MMDVAHQPLRSAGQDVAIQPPAREALTDAIHHRRHGGAQERHQEGESSSARGKELPARGADVASAREFQKLSKVLGELTGVVDMYARYKECQAEEADAREMVKDAAGDLRMEAMAPEEIARKGEPLKSSRRR